MNTAPEALPQIVNRYGTGGAVTDCSKQCPDCSAQAFGRCGLSLDYTHRTHLPYFPLRVSLKSVLNWVLLDTCSLDKGGIAIKDGGGGGGERIKETDKCKPEVMHSTVKHKCIFILYAKPG